MDAVRLAGFLFGIFLAFLILFSIAFAVDAMLVRIGRSLRQSLAYARRALIARGRFIAYTDIGRKCGGPYRDNELSVEWLERATEQGEYMVDQAVGAMWLLGRSLLLAGLLVAGVLVLNEWFSGTSDFFYRAASGLGAISLLIRSGLWLRASRKS